MILQALDSYYHRKRSDPDARIAPRGFEWKGVDFLLLLDSEGRLIGIEDNRELQGKKLVARSHLVPQSVKRSVNISANLLWGNVEYVLGLAQKGKPERTRASHEAFITRIRDELGAAGDAGVVAVLRLLDGLDLKQLEVKPEWMELAESTGNLSFRLQGDNHLLCQRPAVVEAIESNLGREPDDAETRLCAVSGANDIQERLHPAIKGVWGAQSSGANIVSFNLDAFDSYGKSQGYNAPIGKRAAFSYTTALNHLLRRDSPQRLQVGDASTVFWSERTSTLEDDLTDLLGEPAKDDPDAHTKKVRSLYRAVERGGYTPDDDKTGFYVLGLSPNAARISVRFWEVGTVAEISRRIVRNFDDLSIVHGPKDPSYPSLFRLLVHTATQGKADNIPPNLGGDLMRAVLTGSDYPYSLLQAAVRRSRAEQRVDYYRAALIKAVINRRQRHRQQTEKEISVSLDPSNMHPGYRLGRLFAVLEKIQEEALPGINQTIRDKFYGAASASPLSVFSNLMKLKNHHLAKLDNPGRVTNLEKLIGEIVDGVNAFPAQMPLVEQGLFAIGYYHQRQDFFKGKSTEEEGD